MRKEQIKVIFPLSYIYLLIANMFIGLSFIADNHYSIFGLLFVGCMWMFGYVMATIRGE